MEKTLVKNEHILVKGLCLTLLGSLLIALGAFFRIPCYPVSFTLQTFSLSILALTQSPRQAIASVLGYLFLASLGLPILSGGVALPFWILVPTAGYLIAFPLSTYLIARLRERFSPLMALLAGQALIYIIGGAWLIPFFGIKVALMQGVVLFIPSDLLKNLGAMGLVSFWEKTCKEKIKSL